jgi:tRNA(adenine34) deaminase
MISPYNDEYFMRVALSLAREAEEADEIPVGAIIVTGNKIIGKGYNQTEMLKDSTAHAEMIAITAATEYLGAKYLQGCRMYVTLEPCVMCAGALHWSQIDEVVFGATDPKKGYSSYSSESGQSVLHPSTVVKSGILEKECSTIVENFFKRIRDRK